MTMDAAYHKAYHEAHRDRILARQAVYYEAHKVAILTQQAAYHEAHKEQARARDAVYRAAHKEQTRARQVDWQTAHREEIRAQKAAYNETHKEEIHARKAAYRAANPLYSIWHAMLARTEKPTNHNYKYYGGRGIKVCAEWHDYKVFVAWIDANLGPRTDGHSLDRINNDGNYEPGNLRWATAKTQAQNRRARKFS